MSVAVQYKVAGLRALDQALHELPDSLQKGALSTGVRAGARVIGLAARRRAPKDTGKLQRNIVWQKNQKFSRRGRVAFDIAVRVSKAAQGGGASKSIQGGEAYGPNDAYYWYFVEFGTRKMAAQPFLRPAAEENQRAAITAISNGLKAGIARQARKYAAQSRR